MKVYYDVSALTGLALGGDGIYTKNLFRSLRGLGVDLSPVYKVSGRLKDNYMEYHLGHDPSKFRGLFASKGSIIHGPSGSLLSESDKFKKIISVNDLSMFRDGFHRPGVDENLQTHLKQQMQNDVGAVLVPTYEIHNEFLVRFPKYVSRVHVIPPGTDHLFENTSMADSKPYEKPYFLFTGIVDKKSNIAGVIKAFDALCSIKNEFLLVVAGPDGYAAEAIHKMAKTSKFRDNMKFLGFQNDSQLKKLYAGALGTIIPSFYEGYPYSMVEAMKLGCPVVSSALGSMKEVGGEAYHAVNPKDAEQIMAAMERLYADKVYREKLSAAGKEMFDGQTWLKTARAVTDIYHKL